MDTDSMRPPAPCLAALLALGLAAAPAAGADGPGGLAVLGHGPGARPAGELVGELLWRFAGAAGGEVPPAVPGEDPPDDGLLAGGALPRSSTLVPSTGPAGVRRIGLPLESPLCVIGPDPISRRWLARHRARLATLGARCVLVRTTGRAEVDALRRLAHPVPVHPLPFDRLAAVHGIATVPVLLVGTGGLEP